MGGRQAVGRVASGRWSGVVAILAMVVAASGVDRAGCAGGSGDQGVVVDGPGGRHLLQRGGSAGDADRTCRLERGGVRFGDVPARDDEPRRGVRCRGDRVPGHCCLAGGVMVVDGDLWRFDDCVDVDVGQRVRVGGQGDKHDGLVDGSVRQRRWSAGHLDGDRHGERVGCAGADGQGGVQERVDDRRLEGTDERPAPSSRRRRCRLDR